MPRGRGRRDGIIWLRAALGQAPTKTRETAQVPVPSSPQEASPRQGGVAGVASKLFSESLPQQDLPKAYSFLKTKFSV